MEMSVSVPCLLKFLPSRSMYRLLPTVMVLRKSCMADTVEMTFTVDAGVVIENDDADVIVKWVSDVEKLWVIGERCYPFAVRVSTL